MVEVMLIGCMKVLDIPEHIAVSERTCIRNSSPFAVIRRFATNQFKDRFGPMSPPARVSDFNAFGDRERVFQIDAKVPNGAIHLGVT